MDEPWMIFFEELQERESEIPDEPDGGEEELAEVVHEAYVSTSHRLTNQLDWRGDDASQIAKQFGSVFTAWAAEGRFDWEDLRERLESHQQEWEVLKGGF